MLIIDRKCLEDNATGRGDMFTISSIFLWNAGFLAPYCDILYGQNQMIVKAFVHKRGLSCKEGSSTDTKLARDYDVNGHVNS